MASCAAPSTRRTGELVRIVAPASPRVLRVGLGDLAEVDDSGARRVERSDPGGRRLDLADLGAVDSPEVLGAVRPRPLLERLEALHLASASVAIRLTARLVVGITRSAQYSPTASSRTRAAPP